MPQPTPPSRSTALNKRRTERYARRQVRRRGYQLLRFFQLKVRVEEKPVFKKGPKVHPRKDEEIDRGVSESGKPWMKVKSKGSTSRACRRLAHLTKYFAFKDREPTLVEQRRPLPPLRRGRA
jgi:hypothetical protein